MTRLCWSVDGCRPAAPEGRLLRSVPARFPTRPVGVPLPGLGTCLLGSPREARVPPNNASRGLGELVRSPRRGIRAQEAFFMSTTSSSTSPNDRLPIEDLFERALAAGVTRGEIEALILQAREARRPARCPECAADLVVLANVTR